jgi:conjugative transfer signal peptidase TraF
MLRGLMYVGAGLLLLLSVTPTLFGVSPPFLLQATPSEPQGIYRLRSLQDPLQRGMLVTLHVPPSVAGLVFDHGWLPRSWNGAETVLLKPVAGLVGDTFCVSDAGVTFNDIWVGPVYRELGGVTLPELRGCWVVDADQVVLLSALPASFDSRYFGVVSRDALQREAVPLWIWE